jgi:hypothetical protein
MSGEGKGTEIMEIKPCQTQKRFSEIAPCWKIDDIQKPIQSFFNYQGIIMQSSNVKSVVKMFFLQNY